MKVRAKYTASNPFHPDVTRLTYTKTVEVPDDTDWEQLKQFAIDDTLPGYRFTGLIKMPDDTPVSPLNIGSNEAPGV